VVVIKVRAIAWQTKNKPVRRQSNGLHLIQVTPYWDYNMKTKDGSNQHEDAGKPANKHKFEYGFTAMDNRLFYLQQDLTPSEFSVFVRIYRATEGYDGRPRALSGTYLQKVCNMSKNTVTSAIKGLEKQGLICVKRRQKSTSLYLINLEKMDDMYQEIKGKIIEDFENMSSDDDSSIPNIGGHKDDINNLDSQNLTMTIPKSDHLIPNIRPCDSQILGTNKERYKEKYKENICVDDQDKDSDNDSTNPFLNQSQNDETVVKKDTKRGSALTKSINIPFDEFWSMYDKKQDRGKCEKKWLKLTDEERLLTMNHLPAYIESTPNKQYRKHPHTYLNSEAWNNEVISNLSAITNQQGFNYGQQQSEPPRYCRRLNILREYDNEKTNLHS